MSYKSDFYHLFNTITMEDSLKNKIVEGAKNLMNEAAEELSEVKSAISEKLADLSEKAEEMAAEAREEAAEKMQDLKEIREDIAQHEGGALGFISDKAKEMFGGDDDKPEDKTEA